MVTYRSRQGPAVLERRREELASFLKARRARLSPEDVGMPRGARRRTPGLRREEVALLAGVGVTWYTWLEQGREINASMQVLEHSLPCVHRNTLWCCATEPTAREQFPQYDEELRYLVARMRAAYGKHVGDQEWEEDIRRLCGLSREFAELWARHEVADAEPRIRTFIHSCAGPLTFTVTELQIPAMADARLTAYTPADDQTRARLPLTRRAR